MKYKVDVKMSGVFDLKIIHGDGSIDEYPNCTNLITNQGKDIYGNIYPSGYSGTFGGVTVGTGNTTPTVTDTVLAAPLAATANATANSEVATSLVAPYATTASVTFTYAVGAVVGNIAEVGMTLNKGTLAAGDKLFSRALILVGGSPGTITLVSTDQLIVTYTLTFTYAADTTGSMTVTTNGVPTSINYTVRPCQLGNTSGSIPALSTYIGKIAATGWNFISSTVTAFTATNTRPGTSHSAPFLSSTTYTAGSFTQSFTFQFASGTAFSQQMYCPLVSGFMNFQILFASAFGPSATQNMQFQVTYTWT